MGPCPERSQSLWVGAVTRGPVRCEASAVGGLGRGCLSSHQVAGPFSSPHLPPDPHSKHHPKYPPCPMLTILLGWAPGHVWTESPRGPTPGPGLHVSGHRRTGLTREPGPDTPRVPLQLRPLWGSIWPPLDLNPDSQAHITNFSTHPPPTDPRETPRRRAHSRDQAPPGQYSQARLSPQPARGAPGGRVSLEFRWARQHRLGLSPLEIPG